MGVAIGVIVLGVLVAITPRFLFPVCEYEGIFMQLGNDKTTHMGCYFLSMASYVMGTMVALVGLTLLLAKGRETIRMLSVILGGAGIAVMVLPFFFPICLNPDHPCNRGAKPLIMVLGIVTLMSAGYLGLSSRKPPGGMSSIHDAA